MLHRAGAQITPPPPLSAAALFCCWSSGSQLKTVIYARGSMQHSLITHSHFENQQIITVYIMDLMGPSRFRPFHWPVIWATRTGTGFFPHLEYIFLLMFTQTFVRFTVELVFCNYFTLEHDVSFYSGHLTWFDYRCDIFIFSIYFPL